ncbi:hypothetical protein Bca52824_020066 [Brassica carinata]|uniref:Uncharacterized protein n=1 Tax=Brassica carinata TaxID=52824 RepID=A0A8X8AY24_BRACI|nr:hypothetical protein Bca52824_020066 [Brassica carinata]
MQRRDGLRVTFFEDSEAEIQIGRQRDCRDSEAESRIGRETSGLGAGETEPEREEMKLSEEETKRRMEEETKRRTLRHRNGSGEMKLSEESNSQS